jgi:hypothetical protein
MNRKSFIKIIGALGGVSLISKRSEAQFSSAAVVIVLERIFNQVLNSKDLLTDMFKHADKLVTDVDAVVDFLELKGWFSKIAHYNQELGYIAYGTKQLINVYKLGKAFESQIPKIEEAQSHYLKAYKIVVKALTPKTRASIKERIEMFKEADKELSQGRKIIKQTELLIAQRVDQIRRQEKYYKNIKSKI